MLTFEEAAMLMINAPTLGYEYYRKYVFDTGDYDLKSCECIQHGELITFPFKNGWLNGYSTTAPSLIMRSTDHFGSSMDEPEIKDRKYNYSGTPSEKTLICNVSEQADMLSKAINTSENAPKIGTPILILDSGKKHKFNAYRKPQRGNDTLALYYEYIDDSEITSMYFSAVNTVNTIREEQTNERNTNILSHIGTV